MSLALPVLNVSQKQQISNKIDIRVYDGCLYICKIEDDNSVLYGAPLILDSLPAAAVYGNSGSVEALVLSSDVNLSIDYDTLTPAQKTELQNKFTAAITANLTIPDAIVTITNIAASL
tara:strand:+ start:5087 stop:5440 length:354 start_codon:yes stop_codon:yes gene_type:complete